MAKLTLSDVTGGYAIPATLNANNTLIETALENTLSRDGTSPNTMSANLDMNSNRVVNLTTPLSSAEAANKAYVDAAVASINDSATIASYLADSSDVAKGDALVAFKQSNTSGALTGATARTVHQKLQELVSVKDFGAVGDGVTNDTTAITAAITAANGKTLYFPSGTYLTDPQVFTVASGIKLKGDGIGKSIVKANATVATTAVFSTTSNGLELEGLTIDVNRALNSGATSFVGIKAGDIAVAAAAMTGFRMTNCRVTGSANHNVQLYHAKGAVVTGNEIDDFTGFGIILFRAGLECVIANNHIDSTIAGSYGIVLDDRSTDSTTSEPCLRNVVVGNTINLHDTGANGITLEGCSYNTVIGNTVIDAAERGIYLVDSGATAVPNTQSSNNIVMGNTITGLPSISSSFAAIGLTGGDYNVISGNNLSNNTSRAIIQSLGTDSSTPTGNLIEGNTMLTVGQGISLTAGVRTVIRGNVIAGSALTSIRILPTDAEIKHCVIEDNYINDSTGNGISVESNTFACTDNVVRGNTIRNGGARGIETLKGAAANAGTRIIDNTLINNGGSMTIGVRLNASTTRSYVFGNIPYGVTTPLSDNSGQPHRTFTCAAAAGTTVLDTSVQADSVIILMPTNAAAATLMSSTEALYVSARTADTSFVVTTADGGAAAGTETFAYMILN